MTALREAAAALLSAFEKKRVPTWLLGVSWLGSELAALRIALSSEPLDRETEQAEAVGILVPTRLLRCDWPPNPGLMSGDEQFDAMLSSVRANGILEPLTVRTDWLVIDGSHRLYAARQLGIERVPVQFWTGVEMVA